MPSEPAPQVKLAIAHVLFIDIVGYSKLLITQQTEWLGKLTVLVRETEQFQEADKKGGLVRIPTGDGLALVFRDSPEAPAQCAMELNRRLKAYPELQVRMGIHSGPINEVVDVNGQINVTGAGINVAQRVMDCGDAGHILLSQRIADDLEQYPQWRPCLHDLGPCEVKHGQQLNLVTSTRMRLAIRAFRKSSGVTRNRRFAGRRRNPLAACFHSRSPELPSP